jgi:putative mRNA 3-end processing factor
MRPEALLTVTPAGIYCPAGDFHVDPVRAVPRAVITHGHADHARAGHGAVLATAATLDIMALRHGGAPPGRQPARYGETTRHNGVAVTLHPAGHVLGSAQVAVELDGCRIVVSGDYKRRHDPTCAAFEPVPADVFVTEATFALPVFRHPPDGEEIGRLLHSLEVFPERAHLVGAYTLGKAQRVLLLIREAGHDAPVYVHGAMTAMLDLYRAHGLEFGDVRPVADTPPADMAGRIVLAPPAALADRWSRRLPDPLAAMASGWMGIRARARQRAVELPLTISDHADWPELCRTMDEVAGAEIWVTHGRDDALVRQAELTGRRARALALVGYEDDADT